MITMITAIMMRHARHAASTTDQRKSAGSTQLE